MDWDQAVIVLAKTLAAAKQPQVPELRRRARIPIQAGGRPGVLTAWCRHRKAAELLTEEQRKLLNMADLENLEKEFPGESFTPRAPRQYR